MAREIAASIRAQFVLALWGEVRGLPGEDIAPAPRSHRLLRGALRPEVALELCAPFSPISRWRSRARPSRTATAASLAATTATRYFSCLTFDLFPAL